MTAKASHANVPFVMRHAIQHYIAGLCLLLSFCGNINAQVDTLNTGMTVLGEEQSSAFFPCGQLSDGTRLEYAQMGDCLYILANNTLYVYRILSDSVTVWCGSYFIAKEAPHTVNAPFATIEKYGNDEVLIHREGFTYRCEFKEIQRGINPGNVAEEYEAYVTRIKLAEEVLQVYTRSREHSEP